MAFQAERVVVHLPVAALDAVVVGGSSNRRRACRSRSMGKYCWFVVHVVARDGIRHEWDVATGLGVPAGHGPETRSSRFRYRRSRPGGRAGCRRCSGIHIRSRPSSCGFRSSPCRRGCGWGLRIASRYGDTMPLIPPQFPLWQPRPGANSRLLPSLGKSRMVAASRTFSHRPFSPEKDGLTFASPLVASRATHAVSCDENAVERSIDAEDPSPLAPKSLPLRGRRRRGP